MCQSKGEQEACMWKMALTSDMSCDGMCTYSVRCFKINLQHLFDSLRQHYKLLISMTGKITVSASVRKALTFRYWTFPGREEWRPTCWKREGLYLFLCKAFCCVQCFWMRQHTIVRNSTSLSVSLTSQVCTIYQTFYIFCKLVSYDVHDCVS